MISNDLIVVGAGAAGQMAAIAAAALGRQVCLIEQMDRPGLKILASGGGRCNLTNRVPAEPFQAAFGRQGRFMTDALRLMEPDALCAFFERLGVPTICPDGVHVYPASEKSGDVQSALDRRLGELGVQRRYGQAVEQLWIEDGRLCGVTLKDGRRAEASRVILACGGRSWPKLGGTGGGYELARQAGHNIIAPVPAMVPLVVRESWVPTLAGVSIKETRLRIALPRQSKAGWVGDLLLTHRGLSGPAAMDLSGTVADLLQSHESIPLRVQWVASMDQAAWSDTIEQWRTATGRQQVIHLLRKHIPTSLAGTLCETAGIGRDTTAAQLARGQRDRLLNLLCETEITVTGTEGFDTAYVTRGGVKLSEVDPKTMQSRLLEGLFLAGELLDLDGPCGGYNLQWAFASGHLAGESAARG